jgi:hypothetical protein
MISTETLSIGALGSSYENTDAAVRTEAWLPPHHKSSCLLENNTALWSNYHKLTTYKRIAIIM